MKQTILIVLVVLFAACTENTKTKEQIIQENIAVKLKESMKDPESFEFVSMQITETFSVMDRRLLVNSEKVAEIKELGVPELLTTVENELSFLDKQTDENKEAMYYVSFVAKGVNSLGSIVSNEYSATVLNDELMTVTDLK